MGLISGLLNIIFGNDRNVIAQTAEVFRENTEEGAARAQQLRLGAMAQFAQEFEVAPQGWFDRMMDGVNRLPRPALALGTLGLFLAAMIDPVWFAARMQGIALVPEPLWWLLGVIVSFYFGARHQIKSQQFQKSIARTMSFAPKVVDNISALGALKATSPGVADAGHDAQLATLSVAPDENSALAAWRAQKGAPATK
ncbi:holin family protein [Roseobacter sinensis]|uniref:Holin family protein n=1 Tax=Roseobacter sinensis TaxID=2931391 RepID=A0ABT3BFN3_9RHOB|nr:holin family protein [Roseobacter sp. WL0113]MCV3272401.1 holin family protein [Roseobacter sp. WL0113]